MPAYYLRPSMLSVQSADYAAGATLILSDHNRSPLSIAYDRIEMRDRMANGSMRSYFIAEKRTFGLSWENLPSRATGPAGIGMQGSTRLTSDGYAGANDLVAFYETVRGPFTLNVYADDSSISSWSNLIGPSGTAGIANISVYFSAFSANVQKRGQYFDLVNVTMELEEA
jgi:hypothetical protein